MISYQVIINLIRATTTRQGMKVLCELDENAYPAGQRISDRQLATLNLSRDVSTASGITRFPLLNLHQVACNC